MNSRVVVLGLGALSVLGLVACGSSAGTGAPPQSTLKLGTPNYQTLVPLVTSTLPTPTVPGQLPLVPGEQTHKVVFGDILVRIAKSYCTTAQTLVDYNGWPDGFKHPLQPGDIVKIPALTCAPKTTTVAGATTATVAALQTSTTFDTASGGTYVVQNGDYLSGIAAKTGTTVDAIVAANGWVDGAKHLLVAGQKIKMPVNTG